MGDLLGSLVQGSQKADNIVCHLGWDVTIRARVIRTNTRRRKDE
jgi:hypothetical protein